MPGACSPDSTVADSPVIAGMVRITISLNTPAPTSLVDRVERLADAVAAALAVWPMRLREPLPVREPGLKRPAEAP